MGKTGGVTRSSADARLCRRRQARTGSTSVFGIENLPPRQDRADRASWPVCCITYRLLLRGAGTRMLGPHLRKHTKSHVDASLTPDIPNQRVWMTADIVAVASIPAFG